MELSRNDENMWHARMTKLIKTRKDDMTDMYFVHGLRKTKGSGQFLCPETEH